MHTRAYVLGFPSVRTAAGTSAKSSLFYTWTRDTRDHPILGTRGARAQLRHELAGLGGGATFYKAEGSLHASRVLRPGLVSQKNPPLIPLEIAHTPLFLRSSSRLALAQVSCIHSATATVTASPRRRYPIGFNSAGRRTCGCSVRTASDRATAVRHFLLPFSMLPRNDVVHLLPHLLYVPRVQQATRSEAIYSGAQARALSPTSRGSLIGPSRHRCSSTQASSSRSAGTRAAWAHRCSLPSRPRSRSHPCQPAWV
jgi:hypothetical protein